jgi:hypothetical protein
MNRPLVGIAAPMCYDVYMIVQGINLFPWRLSNVHDHDDSPRR